MPTESAFTPSQRGQVQTRGSWGHVALLAERQHGVVARRQLVEAGMGSNAVDNGLRAGRLHRLHPGVYALGHRVVSREGHWMAAVLAGGARSVLSHRTAAALWGIAAHSGPIEVTSPRSTRSRVEIRRHCVPLPPDEVTVVDGIPVTSSHRTL